MEWRDHGIVLSVRRHGESSIVLSLLTENHGRHPGLVRGGGSKAARGLYQPGNLVEAMWKARLEEQLGFYACELLEANAAALMADADRLAALSAACAVADAALPEREAHQGVYYGTLALLAALQDGEGVEWAGAYVRWEASLIQDLGFGLDLSACAVTGATTGLAFVSPRTGRAVSEEAAGPWRERLLPLPGFLIGDGEATPQSVRDGLRLTEYFLERYIFADQNQKLPPARARLVDRIR